MNHDNKIINALIGKINLCKELNSWGTELCLKQLNEILDLINRLQAELERLNNHIINLKCEKERQKAEIERLNNECFCLSNERDAYKDVLDTAVAEAVKEFAESFKKLSRYSVMVDGDREIPGTRHYSISEISLDKLVKEKLGDAE